MRKRLSEVCALVDVRKSSSPHPRTRSRRGGQGTRRADALHFAPVGREHGIEARAYLVSWSMRRCVVRSFHRSSASRRCGPAPRAGRKLDSRPSRRRSPCGCRRAERTTGTGYRPGESRWRKCVEPSCGNGYRLLIQRDQQARSVLRGEGSARDGGRLTCSAFESTTSSLGANPPTARSPAFHPVRTARQRLAQVGERVDPQVLARPDHRVQDRRCLPAHFAVLD